MINHRVWVSINCNSLSRQVTGVRAVPVSWGLSAAKSPSVEVQKQQQLGTVNGGSRTRCFVTSSCHRLTEMFSSSNSDEPRPSLGRAAKQVFL